jgi:hypothetical protein
MTTTTLPAKRKRAQVSYLDQDDELDQLLPFQDAGTLTDATDDDDTTYGSRKVGVGLSGLGDCTC